jgi:hypothetical protein
MAKQKIKFEYKRVLIPVDPSSKLQKDYFFSRDNNAVDIGSCFVIGNGSYDDIFDDSEGDEVAAYSVKLSRISSSGENNSYEEINDAIAFDVELVFEFTTHEFLTNEEIEIELFDDLIVSVI